MTDDIQYAVAAAGDATTDEQLPNNLPPDVIRAIVRIALGASDGDDADALGKAFDLLDDDTPSVSDLTDLADDVGADLSDLGSGETTAAAASRGSTSGSVSLTANTRRVAEAHGLPTNWSALEGIDLPQSLADATLDDHGLAAAINTANGWSRSQGEGIPPRRVGNLRDKGGSGSPGVSASVLNDDDAGAISDLDADQPLPSSAVRKRVESHLDQSGRSTSRNTSGNGFGVGLDDLDDS